MPLLEPNFYGLWLGKQTAKGTPNTAPSRRPIQVGGSINAARDDGEENYSDLSKYGNRTDWVNTLIGRGDIVAEATPIELAYLLWLFHGAETVSAIAAQTGPPAIPAVSRHAFVPSPGLGHYFTAFQRVGQSVIQRRQFNDCIINKLVIESSSANKAARVTPSIISLDPGVIYGTDPTAVLPTERPYLFTDASVNAGTSTDGAISVDGVTMRGVTQFNVTIDDAWDVVYGDDTRPYDFQQGTPSVTVACTVHADAVGLARFNTYVYGTASPAAGTKPLRSIPALGSFRGLLRQRDSQGAHNGLALDATVPGVKWAIPDAPAPNPDGGATEFALAGTMRVVPAQQPYTINVDTPTGTAAFTA